jgi:hypothetical protein
VAGVVTPAVCPGGEDWATGQSTPPSGESGLLHLLITGELFRKKRRDHSAAGVEGGRVMLLGGWDSPLTGEITGEYSCGFVGGTVPVFVDCQLC